MTPDDDRELAYYRAVEDLFATLRGVPHTLSPKDFQLVRSWWRDEVPLSAIRTGLTEVFARRLERGDERPIVSLGYCRHAVEEHAQRIAEMRIGAPGEIAEDPAAVAAAVAALARRLADSAAAARPEMPRVADVIDGIAVELRTDLGLPRALLEQHLYDLESTLLGNCLEALDDADREAIERRARREAETVAADPEARERTTRAFRDRLMRDLIGLPRLEIDP
jgi:hypothetical protein